MKKRWRYDNNSDDVDDEMIVRAGIFRFLKDVIFRFLTQSFLSFIET